MSDGILAHWEAEEAAAEQTAFVERYIVDDVTPIERAMFQAGFEAGRDFVIKQWEEAEG